jgi:hypothetical protein
MQNRAPRQAGRRASRAARQLMQLSCQKEPLSVSQKDLLVTLRRYSQKMINARIRLERRHCLKLGLPKYPPLQRAHFSLLTRIQRSQTNEEKSQMNATICDELLSRVFKGN